jgi:hypothetical protein
MELNKHKDVSQFVSNSDSEGLDSFLSIIGSGFEETQGFKELCYLREIRPESVVLEYESELLALYHKYNRLQGSSLVNSVTVNTLVEGLRSLLRGESLVVLSEEDMEFREYEAGISQSGRILSVFRKEGSKGNNDVKVSKGNKSYYLYSILWRDVDTGACFTGFVYESRNKVSKCYSRNFIKYPFKAKTFEVDVCKCYEPLDYLELLGFSYQKDELGYYYYHVLDTYSLNKAYQYYERWFDC